MASSSSRSHGLTPASVSADKVGQIINIQGVTRRVVASPHPNYMFAMLTESATPYALFHSKVLSESKAVAFDATDDTEVQYLPHWEIHHIATNLLAADQKLAGEYEFDATSHSEQQVADRVITLTSIQTRIGQEYANVREIIQEWIEADAKEKELRDQDTRTLVLLDDDKINESGGLVMRSYWRRELGWKGDISAKSVHKGGKYEFFAESLIPPRLENGSFSKSGPAIRWKYVWNHAEGVWRYACNCQGMRNKRKASRMELLSQRVQAIMKLRDESLDEHGFGHMTKLKPDLDINFVRSDKGKNRATTADEMEISPEGMSDSNESVVGNPAEDADQALKAKPKALGKKQNKQPAIAGPPRVNKTGQAKRKPISQNTAPKPSTSKKKASTSKKRKRPDLDSSSDDDDEHEDLDHAEDDESDDDSEGDNDDTAFRPKTGLKPSLKVSLRLTSRNRGNISRNADQSKNEKTDPRKRLKVSSR